MPTPTDGRMVMNGARIFVALLTAGAVAFVQACGAGTSVKGAPTSAPTVVAGPSRGGMETLTVTGGTREIAAGDHANEIQGVLYVPSDTAAPSKGVVLVQHGGHNPCAQSDDPWPCASPSDRTPSYLGYEWLARSLVGQGYVVLSMGANGTVGAADVGSENLVVGYWTNFLQTAGSTTTGPLGSRLTGRVKLSHLILVGHSRGADAIAQFLIAGGDPAYPASAAVLLAPVLPVDSPDRAPQGRSDVPTLTLVGTCDGDAARDGVRYSKAFSAPSSRLVMVTGANHNYFNTQWTPGTGVADAIDDAVLTGRPECSAGSPTRLTAKEQQARGARILLQWLRTAQG